eukprot:TRINITY_DN3284_c0_g1_i1.p2 TRINITY_DN3284_c0_g1~~TRINITY_DN3284_c0_g1_i1.p2  ORF type:complete len:260 (+),score=80.58 TRINITY_DN3284_c0_g1_i1:84-863(+)
MALVLSTQPVVDAETAPIVTGASPEALQAVLRLEEQCGSADATLEILRVLKGVAEYGGGGACVERRLDTTGSKFRNNVGRYAAGRELVALLGFIDRNGDGFATMPTQATSDPGAVAAVMEGIQRLTPEASPALRAVASPTATPSPTLLRSGSVEDPASLRKRNPLTRRLPSTKKISSLTDRAVTDDKDAINAAVRDGTSFVCHLCSGVVPVDRYDQHMTMWCPALSDGDEGDAAPQPRPPPALTGARTPHGSRSSRPSV